MFNLVSDKKTVRSDSRVILLLSGLISTPVKRRKFTSSLADRRASWLRSKTGQLPAARRASCQLRSKAGQLPAAQQGGPAAGSAARRASCRLRNTEGQLAAAQQGGPAAGCTVGWNSCRQNRKVATADPRTLTRRPQGPLGALAAYPNNLSLRSKV